MATMTVTKTIADDGGRTIARSSSYSGSSEINVVESIANGQTDKAVSLAVDVSATKAFYIVSDVAVTIETNDGSSPDDTISLKAGVPYEWNTDSYDSFLLTADVTVLYVTNASGATCNLLIKGVQDATP